MRSAKLGAKVLTEDVFILVLLDEHWKLGGGSLFGHPLVRRAPRLPLVGRRLVSSAAEGGPAGIFQRSSSPARLYGVLSSPKSGANSDSRGPVQPSHPDSGSD